MHLHLHRAVCDIRSGARPALSVAVQPVFGWRTVGDDEGEDEGLEAEVGVEVEDIFVFGGWVDGCVLFVL